MRIRALVVRIIRQFLRDKRTLALMIAAPMLILWMMSLVFNGSTYEPKIGAVQLPDRVSEALRAQGAAVTAYSADEAERALEKQETDATVSMDGPFPRVKLEGSDPSKNKSVLLLLQNALKNLNPAVAQAQNTVIVYLHGSDTMAAFDNFGPVLIGYFAFFFVFLIAGVSFLKERTSGTLERLLATPLRRWEIVAGYIVGFGLFTALQAVLIAWFAVEVLGLMLAGSFWYVLLITVLLAMTALSLGTFLSAFANTEFQMIQFIPLVIVPQVFFSGLFSMDTMAEWMRWLGKIMPLTYGADALRNIMIRGQGWDAIAVDVWVLVALSLAFMAGNVVALRKHRKI